MRLTWLGIPVGIINILILWYVVSWSESAINLLEQVWRMLS